MLFFFHSPFCNIIISFEFLEQHEFWFQVHISCSICKTSDCADIFYKMQKQFELNNTYICINKKMHSSRLNNFLIYFRVFRSLPIYSQHLLVLLIGTFRVIHSNSERAKTGMTAEALGVSVAPSFFHTCVSEGSKIAKPDEVQKFKVNFMINISRQNIILIY